MVKIWLEYEKFVLKKVYLIYINIILNNVIKYKLFSFSLLLKNGLGSFVLFMLKMCCMVFKWFIDVFESLLFV